MENGKVILLPLIPEPARLLAGYVLNLLALVLAFISRLVPAILVT
jgi:hypothetical protein